MAEYVQPTFPDDETLPPEIRNKVIGYVVDPNFVPNPLDVGTVRTDGHSGQEGYDLGQYSPLFHQSSQGPLFKRGYNSVPAIAHAVAENQEEEKEEAHVQEEIVTGGELEDNLRDFSAKVSPEKEEVKDK